MIKSIRKKLRKKAVGGADEDFTFVIADLGSAIYCNSKPAAVGADVALVDCGLTQVGTYQFRAPEMFAKEKGCNFGYPSDVWALGVTII